MLVFFTFIGGLGVAAIVSYPKIILSLNPLYALRFLTHNGLAGFFMLSEVILCATGGEALFADMGHLPKDSIHYAWRIVFFALILNYFGQGAFLLRNPQAHNTFFELAQSLTPVLYIPFLLLTIAATVIASQAMISSMFSIFYQAITTHIFPILKVDYTSSRLRSQIYIDVVNWSLLACVIFVMILFKKSDNLASAYGLAVTGNMFITAVMMTYIFFLTKHRFKAALAIFVGLIEMAFLAANIYKIPHGGYWSLIIASFPLVFILFFTYMQRFIFQKINLTALPIFLKRYNQAYKQHAKIEGKAIFLISNITMIPPYVVNTMFMNGIIYEENIFLSIHISSEPFGVSGEFKQQLAEGLQLFEITAGYMEILDVEKLLKSNSIHERAIFYGVEDIVTTNYVYKCFAIVKKVTPSFVQFYKLHPNKIHGVVTMIEL